MTEVVIHHRFCGPPTSGNGGYTSGILAKHLEGPVEVTLRQPPPLDKPLQLERDGEHLNLKDGDALIAEAKQTTLHVEPPPPTSFAEARAASKNFIGFTQHFYSGCFVCGTERGEGDGMRIFAGPAGDIVAAPWQPDASLAGGDGYVADEFIWAALDCPGFFAAFIGKNSERALLGRMSADIHGKVEVGKNYIVIGWPEQEEGRKYIVGTAIYDEGGKLLAVARGVWIRV